MLWCDSDLTLPETVRCRKLILGRDMGWGL